MKLVEHIVEPKKLLVLWQALDGTLGKATGERFIVGEIINNGINSTLTYFDNEDTRNAVSKGFKGLTSYPFLASKTYNDNIETVLANRLPPDTRGDYEDFLKAYRLSPAAAKNVSPLSLLANTTGNLMGDGFTFLPVLQDVAPPFQFTFDIAGFRYCEGMTIQPIGSLQGAEVVFMHEKENNFDKDAVAIYYSNKKLGYVPKGLNRAILDLQEKNHISATVERINGTVERPNILVFTEITK